MGAQDDPPKKDLTGILEYSKKMQGDPSVQHRTPDSGAPMMEEAPIEKIDEFESLDEYSKANPMPELPPDGIPETDPESLPPPSSDALDFPTSDPGLPDPDEDPFASPADELPPELPPDAGAESSDISSAITGVNAHLALGTDGLADSLPPEAIPQPPTDLAGIEPTAAEAPAPPAPDEFVEPPPAEPSIPPPLDEPAPAAGSPASVTAAEMAAERAHEADLAKQASAVKAPKAPPPAPKAPMERIKQFAERVTPGKPAVPAAYPFSLLILGKLTPEDKEKLVDIVTRENMGFSEMDLEPQLNGGRVLLPRISEYAGILIVQALRHASVKVTLGPSDAVFSTDDTREDSSPLPEDQPESVAYSAADSESPAETIQITRNASIPGTQYVVIDVVTVSASLKSSVVEAESSSEYQEILSSLQRELKHRAHRRGANAILNYSVSLTPLSLPTHYRLTVTGSAVKLSGGESRAEPPLRT